MITSDMMYNVFTDAGCQWCIVGYISSHYNQLSRSSVSHHIPQFPRTADVIDTVTVMTTRKPVLINSVLTENEQRLLSVLTASDTLQSLHLRLCTLFFHL